MFRHSLSLTLDHEPGKSDSHSLLRRLSPSFPVFQLSSVRASLTPCQSSLTVGKKSTASPSPVPQYQRRCVSDHQGPRLRSRTSACSSRCSIVICSEKYFDDTYEYRHVVLPPEVSKLLPKNRLLSEFFLFKMVPELGCDTLNYQQQQQNQAMLAK
ncbi:hypothetical protein M0R45_002665 [Rubus argutus]|uniref:Cyclin-dependent kinases regulatory subunit n=1 Tax=Rubus argutus TaxID=59490 RepID=A0AAW1VPR6_RUBAR